LSVAPKQQHDAVASSSALPVDVTGSNGAEAAGVKPSTKSASLIGDIQRSWAPLTFLVAAVMVLALALTVFPTGVSSRIVECINLLKF